MTKGAKLNRQGNGAAGVTRFDMTELAGRKQRGSASSNVAVVDRNAAKDAARLEELIESVIDKVKELKLAGMINKNGADWIQTNLIKGLAVIEGMK